MRWDNLFDDLEGQLEQEFGAEEIDLRAEEERLRLGRVSLRERIGAIAAAQPAGACYGIDIQLISGDSLRLRPTTFGKDWIAGDVLEESARACQCVLPLAAIAGLLLTSAQVRESLEPERRSSTGPQLADRIGIAFVLRDLCRRRVAIEAHTSVGTLHGTIDRVGRDHLDLALHEPGEVRRARAVSGIRVVPLTQLSLVRL